MQGFTLVANNQTNEKIAFTNVYTEHVRLLPIPDEELHVISIYPDRGEQMKPSSPIN